MNEELEQLKKAKNWVKKVWAASLGIVFALFIGFISGTLYVENRIIDDCRFSSVFRIGLQSFNCGRKT